MDCNRRGIHSDSGLFLLSDSFRLIIIIMSTRGEGGLRPPSSLVRVAGATLISSEEVVFREFIQLLSVISILRVR